VVEIDEDPKEEREWRSTSVSEHHDVSQVGAREDP
jgi:hypothetical protein